LRRLQIELSQTIDLNDMVREESTARLPLATVSINVDDHALMRLFHKPTDEKRMVVILPDDRYDDWLNASAERSHSFLRHCPAHALQATPASAAHAARSD